MRTTTTTEQAIKIARQPLQANDRMPRFDMAATELRAGLCGLNGDGLFVGTTIGAVPSQLLFLGSLFSYRLPSAASFSPASAADRRSRAAAPSRSSSSSFFFFFFFTASLKTPTLARPKAVALLPTVGGREALDSLGTVEHAPRPGQASHASSGSCPSSCWLLSSRSLPHYHEKSLCLSPPIGRETISIEIIRPLSQVGRREGKSRAPISFPCRRRLLLPICSGFRHFSATGVASYIPILKN